VKTLGVNLIDASSGGNVSGAGIPVAPGYQVGFSERIHREAGILTGAVGMITTADQAESIIESGQADLVLLAREFLRDPHFPMHASQRLGVTVSAPKQYHRAFSDSVKRG
jgi:2,4-dienoyl-CoA reductase-like NADH-dependent reductase (Old Yellow Enzyme family)